MVFFEMVDRSRSKLWKLCTGRFSVERLRLAFSCALVERSAGPRLSQGFRLVRLVVLEEHWRRPAGHVDLDIVGEHAEQDVCPDPLSPAGGRSA